MKEHTHRAEACRIKRTPWPKFSGAQEDWPQFSRITKDIMKISGHGEALRMAQLSDSLSQEWRLLITGVSNKEEAWAELDKKYGNR